MPEEYVGFYEREFYPLSNFSAFQLNWKGHLYQTLEHAYHAEKFNDIARKEMIRWERSAHEAFKTARAMAVHVRPDWDDVKLDVMRELLRAKVDQHAYVRKKLIETDDRPLIEDSWRDDFWGWGENKDGQNWLGRLWMEIRDEIRAEATGG